MYNFYSNRIPDTERNRIRLQRIREQAKQMLGESIQSLNFSKFKLFHETGNRLDYENEYMIHRSRLNLMAAMALSDESEEWLEAVEDILWAICDEVTWAFPAYIAKDADVDAMLTRLDLFAAETAIALSEICYLLKDRLHPIVFERVQYELKRRVITPHMKTVMTYRSNWSAVCACGLCSAIVHSGTREEFEEAKEALVCSAYDFLDSYTEDGCCLEGPTYWSYGFSHFCFLAQMLREQTDGEIDLFREEKVKNIALYMQKTSLEEDYVVPFGDASHRYRFEYCLVNLLNYEYEEFAAPTPEMLALHEYGDSRERFARFMRDFYWTEEVLPPKKTQDGMVKWSGAGWSEQSEKNQTNRFEVFEKSQQYIRRFDNFIFAAKGGHNAEPHNHNDIGSFIIFSDGQYLLDDLGWAEYDNKYFTSARYDNICASSLGHSVPIINGKAQLPGSDRKASATLVENRISLDISSAYEVTRFSRDFVFKENDTIEIEDCFEDDKLQITERFVTRVKPELLEGDVRIGPLTVTCESPCRVQISSQEFQPRVLGDLNIIETAYFIDFIFEEIKCDQKVTFTIYLRK